MAATRIAAIHYRTGFPIDDLLRALGERLRADSVRLGGIMQSSIADAGNPCADMMLTELGSGARIEISQRLGPLAQGCRLDSGRLAEVGVLLERAFSGDLELLILNKFGRAEAEGHGLRRNFARAMEAGVPVLTAVRPPYDEAWQDFHGGLASALEPDIERVHAWCLRAVEEQRRIRRSMKQI